MPQSNSEQYSLCNLEQQKTVEKAIKGASALLSRSSISLSAEARGNLQYSATLFKQQYYDITLSVGSFRSLSQRTLG
jgi:hypothetical protein